MTIDEALREIADLNERVRSLEEWQQAVIVVLNSNMIRLRALEKDAMRNGSQVVTMRPHVQPVYRTLGSKLGD